MIDNRQDKPSYTKRDSDSAVSDDLRQAVDTLCRGGLILYPTDTVWGIGCDATNVEAVKRVYRLKGRDDNKALITLVADFGALERTVDGIPEVAYDLIEYSDRPLTIVYDHAIGVCPELTGADGSLGVRVTHESFSAALCRALHRPLVSTSANVSGQPTPRLFADIDQAIIEGVDYVCATGRDRAPGLPSVVMRLHADGQFKILRQ